MQCQAASERGRPAVGRAPAAFAFALCLLLLLPSTSAAASLDTVDVTGRSLSFQSIDIHAQSRPGGVNPSGTGTYFLFGTEPVIGPITCLKVIGPDRGAGTAGRADPRRAQHRQRARVGDRRADRQRRRRHGHLQLDRGQSRPVRLLAAHQPLGHHREADEWPRHGLRCAAGRGVPVSARRGDERPRDRERGRGVQPGDGRQLADRRLHVAANRRRRARGRRRLPLRRADPGLRPVRSARGGDAVHGDDLHRRQDRRGQQPARPRHVALHDLRACRWSAS